MAIEPEYGRPNHGKTSPSSEAAGTAPPLWQRWLTGMAKQTGEGRWRRRQRQATAAAIALTLTIALLFLANLVVTVAASAAVPGSVRSASPGVVGKTGLTWYGQSAFRLVTPKGHVLWIDPWLRNPMNPNGEKDLAAIDRADALLISHGHFDHVGDAVAIAQKTRAKLVSTFDLGRALVGAAGYPADLVGFDTQGNFGGQISLFDGEVTVAFVPAVHSSSVASDGSPAPFYGGNPGGFWLSVRQGPTIYHTGDTDVFNDMSLIRQFGPIDLMLACIGGQFTMGPERAAEAVDLVKPKVVVPMHYGTFNLKGTPQQFQRALAQRSSPATLRVMTVGEEMAL